MDKSLRADICDTVGQRLLNLLSNTEIDAPLGEVDRIISLLIRLIESNRVSLEIPQQTKDLESQAEALSSA